MAEALVDAGAAVVICARNEERCSEVAERLSAAGGQAIGMRCDVRNREDIAAVIDRAQAETGRIDILVNNSGTTWGAPATEVPVEGWQKVIDVNLTGTFLFAQAVGRVMIGAGTGGSIINISSIAGSLGMKPEVIDAVPYNASKGALDTMTMDLAVKWARHGIRVNAIAPGWFPSDMASHVLDHSGPLILDRVPMGRFGGPDELKGAALFLASPASSYVTGQILVVDGGYSAS
jgi:gluconate 5-dehydrogenase